jgi:hypothetical protein
VARIDERLRDDILENGRHLVEESGDVLHERYAYADVAPTTAEIETALGYASGGASAAVLQAVSQLIQNAADLWTIEGGCVIYPVTAIDRRRRTIEVRGVRFDVGAVVCGQLAEAESVAAFLCTAGRGIEDLARKYMSAGDSLMGFIADALGSLVVEKAMDRIQERLADVVAARGLRITERYSPGYCGWLVAEQQKLFRLLPADFCGVRLSETSLMQPIKTVSGLIGLGTRAERRPYECSLCDVDDCLYRRLRSRDGGGVRGRGGQR